MKVFTQLGLGLALTIAVIAAKARADKPVAADLVVMEGKIYTEDAQHRTVQALAVRDSKIVYAGANAGVAEFIGPKTTVERLGGRLVLPGLVDAHIHPMGIVQLDTCDLKSQPKSLAEITDFVRACIAQYQIKSGEWLTVQQWNFATGNQPDAEHPSSRRAAHAA